VKLHPQLVLSKVKTHQSPKPKAPSLKLNSKFENLRMCYVLILMLFHRSFGL
jgi:hypothetical protein